MIAVILFYDVSYGKQSWLSFSARYRHCNVITFDGDVWLNIDMDQTGIHTRKVNITNTDRLVANLSRITKVTDILVIDITKPKKWKWFPWWVRSCNELVRYITNIDVGWTFNPRHLYSKLLKYDGMTNFSILAAWRRHGIIRRR